jgi:hypothetical protein
MARFRSLSEAVRHHVENVINVNDMPQALPLSVHSGQARILDERGGFAINNVMRWGDSTFGVEPATGYLFPGQLSTTNSENDLQP